MGRYVSGVVLAIAAGVAAGATRPPALEPFALVQAVGGGEGSGPRTDLPAPVTRPNAWTVTQARAELSGPTLEIPAEQELSGNAVPYYLAAVADLRNLRQQDFDAEKLLALLDAPLDALKAEDVRVLGLSDSETTLRWLRQAVRRPSVEWPNDAGAEGQQGLLVDISGLRLLLTRLALDIRWEIHEGRPEGAIERLRWGYALIDAMAKSRRLIMRVAAAGDERLLTARVAELVKRPGSSNLGWALAELPALGTRMGDAEREDAAYLYEMAPELGRLRDGSFVQADWDAFVARLADPKGFLPEGAVGYNVSTQTPAERKALAEKALTEALPRAREWLGAAAAGKGDGEVLARYLTGTFDAQVAAATRLTALPFAEAHPRLRAAGKTMAADRDANFLLPLGAGSPDSAYALMARADRGVAMLRVVEGVRDFAARHDGRLPETLAAVTELPVPADPITGAAFGYGVQGEEATLSATAPEGLGPRYAESWTLRISK